MALVAAIEVCKHNCCVFFFFLRFYCFSKDIGFHKKTRTKPRENKRALFTPLPGQRLTRKVVLIYLNVNIT